MNKPYRITLWRKNEGNEIQIDFTHCLSNGFGIPAVVINCPIEKNFELYKGLNEYGEYVEGINFDECSSCKYFDSFGFGQEIYCMHLNST